MTRFLLVRHGENPANLSHEFSYRKVDYPLTDRGRLQAKQTAEWLSRTKLDALWSSPLLRAKETAEAIARYQPEDVQVLEDLREMNVGDLEGMVPQDRAWQIYAEVMREWLSGNRDASFPNGETRRQLVYRFRATLERLSRSVGNRTIALVAHGGIFTHGVAELCGIADQKSFFALENFNCSISELEVHPVSDGLRYVLRSWASIKHLSGEAAVVVQSVPESARVRNL